MKTLGYYNGRIDELDKMNVPMLDRACYFGDGVYDVAYCRNYRIYALEEHVERCLHSAALLKMQPQQTKEELCALLTELVQKLDCGELWVYFQFSRGTGYRAHAFPDSSHPNLWVMIRPAEIRDVTQPMRCITARDSRFEYCNIKSLNLLPNVLATLAVEEAGVDECILHRDGIVTECAHSNLSILKDGAVITHPADQWILAGTGRAHLLAFCKALGIAVHERPYTTEELLDADEILITSASALCIRVSEIDGKPVGGKAPALAEKLQKALLEDYLQKTE